MMNINGNEGSNGENNKKSPKCEEEYSSLVKPETVLEVPAEGCLTG